MAAKGHGSGFYYGVAGRHGVMVKVIGQWLVLVVGGASVMAVARGQWHADETP